MRAQGLHCGRREARLVQQTVDYLRIGTRQRIRGERRAVQFVVAGAVESEEFCS